MQEFFVGFLQYLIQGISLGSIYALIAIGYTMVYGILKLINFAHGDVYMVGSYTGLFVASYWVINVTKHVAILPTIVGAMIICALVGFAIEKLAYKPLRQAPKMIYQTAGIGACFGFFSYTFFKWPMLQSILLFALVCGIIGFIVEKEFARKVNITVTLILSIAVGIVGTLLWKSPLLMSLLVSVIFFLLFWLTFETVHRRAFKPAPRIAALITAIGVSLFLEYAMMYWQTPNQKYFPKILPDKIFEIKFAPNLSVYIFGQHIIFFIAAAILVILLWLLVNHTKVGRAMRAVSYDREAAQLMGVNVNNTISMTFAIGSALAGAAGVIFGCFYPFVPFLGIMPGLIAFIAAVLGGIGSLPGAMLGGLLMGVAEQMAVGFGSSALRDVVAFIILIIVLLFKPTGLLGKGTNEKV
jgi:branched-chain amino acid transport system permease protein